jgi:hypothetical protein
LTVIDRERPPLTARQQHDSDACGSISQAVCLHNVSVPNLLVRDVPEDVHARMLARAAERPTIDEVLAGIAARRGSAVGLAQAVEDLAAERERR